MTDDKIASDAVATDAPTRAPEDFMREQEEYDGQREFESDPVGLIREIFESGATDPEMKDESRDQWTDKAIGHCLDAISTLKARLAAAEAELAALREKLEPGQSDRGIDGDVVLRSEILESIGEASVCWEDGQVPTGVFDSARAVQIGDKLLAIFSRHCAAHVAARTSALEAKIAEAAGLLRTLLKWLESDYIETPDLTQHQSRLLNDMHLDMGDARAFLTTQDKEVGE